MPNLAFSELIQSTWETIYIVYAASSLTILIGFGLGLLLFLTRNKSFHLIKIFNQAMSLIINALRSIPFIILMISILPLTRLIIGTTIGINAAIIPLTLAAIPFFARVCENAFAEIPKELFETANSLGANIFQLIHKIIIPESLPAIIRGATLTIVAIIGYSAMAGAVGGGGLGELAINYGYQRFNMLVTLETVIVLFGIVQVIQFVGDRLAKKLSLKPLAILFLIMTLSIFGHKSYTYIYTKEEKLLKVGIISGWSEDILKTAQKIGTEKYHLHLQPIIFTDYIQPNVSLASGDIDANIFQHLPYLEAQNKANGFKLIPLAKTFVYPMGFYSMRVKRVSELPWKAIIAIPNDPSNQARALLLLQRAGLITLRKDITTLASIKDVLNNPNHFVFKLLDAAALPRVLKDADLIAITNDYLTSVGLNLTQALIKEGSDSLYANIIAVKQQDKNKKEMRALIDIMHSQEVLSKTKQLFPNESAIPAW